MKIADYIEHTLLKPDATKEELENVLNEARIYSFKGVCVNPINVEFAKNYLKDTDVKIVTVIGFPLGACLTDVKAFEAKKAIESGADEIDMVLCIQEAKNQNWDYVKKDIETVKKACGDHVLKVILETDLLTDDEILKACEIAIEANADFVKTSTGFVKDGVGATVKDVELMFKTVNPHGLQVKASGGIRDKEKALNLINAGASRLGTSSGVKIASN